MNTYEVFVPLGLKSASLTADEATRAAETLVYLFRGSRNSTTNAGVDIQPVGDTNAPAPIKGVVARFMTDLRLPVNLDDTSTNRGGILLGTASNANGGAIRLTLTSVDNSKWNRMDEWLQPYPMRGDLVCAISVPQFNAQTTDRLEILPTAGAGLPGVFLATNNADAVDGVYQNPYAGALGVACIGNPREAVRVGSQLINVSPRTQASIGRGAMRALRG